VETFYKIIFLKSKALFFKQHIWIIWICIEKRCEAVKLTDAKTIGNHLFIIK